MKTKKNLLKKKKKLTAVDRRVDLYGEQLRPSSRVYVARRLAPRHHAARDRERVASQREPAHAHRLLEARKRLAESDPFEPAPEVVVVDREQSQVALDPDGEDAGDDLGVGAPATAFHGDVVFDAVRVLEKRRKRGFGKDRRRKREGEKKMKRERERKSTFQKAK